MKNWKHRLGTAAILAAMTGVLGGCDDSGPDFSLIRLFFGIDGSGTCDSVVVEVDLDQANAILAGASDEEIQCALNATLDNAGCDIDFEIFGDVLTATITGCDIPGTSSLFSCFFEQVDLSEINDATDAQCICGLEQCNPNPGVCVDEDPDPTICDGGTTTTTFEDTTTTTTSTTSTTGDTTTTTVTTGDSTTTTLGDTQTCTVRFRMTSSDEAGSLQWDTDYSGAPGQFEGAGENVECESLIGGSIASFNDDDNGEVLTSGIISLDGFTGPIDLAECQFLATGNPSTGDFDITVVDASDPDLNPLEPFPTIVVSAIECEGGPTTTIDTTTTTIVGPTTTLEVTTTTIGGPTTTLAPGNEFDVTFLLTSASDAVGALQFTVDYANAPGGFEGAGPTVTCSNEVSGAIFAPNDDEANEELGLGYVSLSGFNDPATLSVCRFIGTGETPEPADFVITIDDASNPDFAPIDVEIDVEVDPAAD